MEAGFGWGGGGGARGSTLREGAPGTGHGLRDWVRAAVGRLTWCGRGPRWVASAAGMG